MPTWYQNPRTKTCSLRLRAFTPGLTPGVLSPISDSHETRVGHRPASPWPRGHPRVRRERSPGAPRSRGRAPCRWDPEVRRWPLLAPYEPPRTAGREWKCQKLPLNILLKCSVCKQNVTLGYGGNTRYAPPCYCPLTLRCPRGGGKSASLNFSLFVEGRR